MHEHRAHRTTTRRRVTISVTLGALVALIATGVAILASPVAAAETNSSNVTVRNVADLTPTARRLGVPDALRSCHTAEIGGYAIEGHVPAADVRRLLAMKPKAAGIAVPGMPMGSGRSNRRIGRHRAASFTSPGGLRALRQATLRSGMWLEIRTGRRT